MEIDARGSEKSLSFCYLKIDNIFCVSRLTREGSGTFIFKSIELKRNAGTDLGQIIRTVKGFDINPLAVQTAKTNYILSVLDLLSLDSEFHIPIYYNDVLKLNCPVDSSQSKNEFVNNVLDSKRRDLNIVEELDRVDLVAGNPPWVN